MRSAREGVRCKVVRNRRRRQSEIRAHKGRGIDRRRDIDGGHRDRQIREQRRRSDSLATDEVDRDRSEQSQRRPTEIARFASGGGDRLLDFMLKDPRQINGQALDDK
ncbi:hypothetical protein TIFTF001_012320 [Ficus carica]|uniref:Uncharacterized protein n=1 Tax=Ficus carica TaxID=3494 RepID=A0AA88D1L0_FICCA|nr:hypothetical protein TIFTF001_012320 [Ficus carica]